MTVRHREPLLRSDLLPKRIVKRNAETWRSEAFHGPETMKEQGTLHGLPTPAYSAGVLRNTGENEEDCLTYFLWLDYAFCITSGNC